MLKKLLATTAAVCLSGAIAFSANLPLITGPQPAADLQGTINQLIRSINTGVGGLLNAQTASAASSATTAEQTLQQYSLPANTLTGAGQSIRVSCWGGTAANADNKTAKLYFGSSVITTPTAATNNKGWWLDMVVMRRTATTQGVMGRGQVDTTAVTPLVTDGAETLTSNVLIKCTGTTSGTASDMTANGLIVELIK